MCKRAIRAKIESVGGPVMHELFKSVDDFRQIFGQLGMHGVDFSLRRLHMLRLASKVWKERSKLNQGLHIGAASTDLPERQVAMARAAVGSMRKHDTMLAMLRIIGMERGNASHRLLRDAYEKVAKRVHAEAVSRALPKGGVLAQPQRAQRPAHLHARGALGREPSYPCSGGAV